MFHRILPWQWLLQLMCGSAADVLSHAPPPPPTTHTVTHTPCEWVGDSESEVTQSQHGFFFLCMPTKLHQT